MSTPALTLFFDGSCPLCAAEMRRMARLDRHGRLGYLDMRGEGFDPAAYGTTFAAMDTALHGVRADGQLLVGIDCIAESYALIGLGWLVWPLRLQATRPAWQHLYRWFARNRYRASRLLGYGCADGICTPGRR